ncbi:MAG: NAD(P)-dependent alcohol dehydrogenase [Candidatus Eremiobacteraeota bacterium]|nr:NAD(P)-dependent alcohol dehydrogenase [Candidatus Eremiobacteraeota bacterium]
MPAIAVKTKAYAAASPTEPLAPFDVERREPEDRDVVIDIKFCGICHSDIHQVRDEWGGTKFPIVPGHEIVGVVSKVGEGVTKFKVGDRAGAGCFVASCGQCENCTRGLEQFCVKGAAFTYNSVEMDKKTRTYGGYSERIVVDEGYVLRVPDALPLDAAAPLLCAGITLYSPLRHWQAGPGKRVAIIGLGGLGHVGVKLAHAMGADVTVLSQSAAKETDAKRLGADHYYATADKGIFKTLAGRFDLIINTVSAVLDWNAYLGLLKVDGTMVLLGIPDNDVPLGAGSLIRGRRSLSGSMIGGIAETQEMLDFCAEHDIVADIELTAIDKVNEAYDRVVKSDVRYRFVIDMSTL